MKRSVLPSSVEGIVKAPASKSMMIRAVAAATLADGVSTLRNPSDCRDAIAAIEISKSIGAKVDSQDELVKIEGTGGKIRLVNDIINCKESGLCVRLFTPVISLSDKETLVTGEGSLLRRPVGMMKEALRRMGVDFEDNEGKLPIRLKGPLRAGKVNVDGSTSSQFVSGLLFALPLVDGKSEIEVINLKSKPYIDMTLSALSDFGVNVKNDGYRVFYVEGTQEYKAQEYYVEGDWSGASFLLVAGAIAGRVRVTGLKVDSLQADRAVMNVLHMAGAVVKEGKNYVEASYGTLRGFDFDATECPDLFPPLVALASCCKGRSKIKGVHRLVYKESNRAEALLEEFQKMGVRLSAENDYIVVDGEEQPEGGRVSSHNDHRIAMACAVAGLASKEGVVISGAEAVEKSYPTFFEDIKKLGAKVR
ncbi:MAG: 3-phosphoshikimate 1-carboxyvinyltransferase [Candidatus Neomarinimicrobiota bacterium]|nr:MAG: 3-phosphoshikimate 1-carboxyvinyltransferase [Candidatus Neomarinimicrobiota bacterium]